jgi:hypothetical protein
LVGALAEPEGDVECVSVDGRELQQLVDERQEDLVQAGEAQSGLELDTGRVENPSAGGRGVICRGVEEPGLANTRLARYEQGSAMSSGGVKEGAKAAELRVAAHQMSGWATVALPFAALRGGGVDHRGPGDGGPRCVRARSLNPRHLEGKDGDARI